MYTYLNCHVFFKYLAILSGNYIFQKMKKEKKQEFQCFLYNLFQILHLAEKELFFFFFPDNNQWDSLDIQKSKKPWTLSRQSSHIKNI